MASVTGVKFSTGRFTNPDLLRAAASTVLASAQLSMASPGSISSTSPVAMDSGASAVSAVASAIPLPARIWATTARCCFSVSASLAPGGILDWL